MKYAYTKLSLGRKSLEQLTKVNSILEDYRKQGYTLTLRQLYYQLVTQNVIKNDDKEYKKLSRLLGEGRMAGIVDWDGIEDRLRSLKKPASWESTDSILRSAIYQYRRDNMEGQDVRIECFVEKDALSGVLSRITSKFGVGLQVQRGYGSITAMKDTWDRVNADDRKFYLLYLGDHDPSGLDMIRDIERRIFEFWWGEREGLSSDDDGRSMPEDFKEWEEYELFQDVFEIIPIALTMEQIKSHNPPPNPAKITDPRAKDYIAKFGKTSWEVDALPPKVLNQLLEDSILSLIDLDKFNASIARQERERKAVELTLWPKSKPSDEEE